MKKEIVFQDGGQFYAARPETKTYVAIAEYGSRLGDYDMAKAQRAREWFIQIWCPKHNIEPTFEDDSFGDIF